MLNSSLQQIGSALRAKQVSSVELTQLYLDRIASLNTKLNAYITVQPEMSLAQALPVALFLHTTLGHILSWVFLPPHPKCFLALPPQATTV